MTVQAQVLMLRGINLGPARRIAMAALRDAFTAAGHAGVRTYVQSGNVVLVSDHPPADLEHEAAALIRERFTLDVPVLARTRAQLAEVVARNPFAEALSMPKRYQVTFLAGELDDDVVARLRGGAAPSEKVAVDGRHVYAWHPAGVARSKLWTALAGKGLGVTATSRNWTTVTALLALAQEMEVACGST